MELLSIPLLPCHKAGGKLMGLLPKPLRVKLLRIMRLITILLFTCIMHAAANTNAQHVTIKVKNASLESVLQLIEKQTGFTYIVKKEVLTRASVVTMDLDQVSVKQALDELFKGQPFTYVIEGQIVSIKPVAEPDSRIISPLLETPPISVRGRIVNEKGEPVIASVTIKGTTRGTTSNANGEFELSNVDDNAVLVISATNIETIAVNVNKQNNLSVSVRTASASLNEVIVNKGYYSESKKLSTGNVARVTGEDIVKSPVSNPLQAIQGRMAGVFITQTSGFAGTQMRLEIRGRNSLRSSVTNDGNYPLYVVDGVPFASAPQSAAYIPGPMNYSNPFNNINPADIESIEILKDADATSIYGSRGANGVVLITTKKGKAGKTTVDFNISTGGGKVARTIDVLNTQQYVMMRKEAFANDNIIPTVDNAPDLMVWDTTRYTDWKKELIGHTAKNTNAQFSVSGGNANTQFVFGGGYYRETTVFPGDFGFKKGSGHFRLNHSSPNGRFKTSLSTEYVIADNDLPAQDYTGMALRLAPNAPSVYTETGELNWTDWENPLGSLFNKYNQKNKNLITSSSFSYNLFSGFILKTILGYNLLQTEEFQPFYIKSYAPYYTGMTGSAFFGDADTKNWSVDPQLNYERKIFSGSLSLLVGGTYQKSEYQNQIISADGFTNDNMIENLKAATSTTIPVFNYSEYKHNAIYGRLGYNWQDKYILNFTARRDGSSKFGSRKMFGNFASVGASWIFSNEHFTEQLLPFISFGKLRASYGTTGNDQIPAYGYLDTYTSTTNPYQGGVGIVPTRIQNTDFSWEINKKLEAAIELGLLKDRISFAVSWYQNRCSNQLIGYPLSVVTGFSSISYNFPATLQNTGWEFELNTRNIKTRDFQWTTSLNFTYPKNKLLAFPEIEKTSFANSAIVGQPIALIKNYHGTGVDPQTGIYTYEDVNKDGKLTSPDDYVAGIINGKKYYGGLQNSFQFKNIQLDFLFQFVKQNGSNYLLGSFDAPGMYSLYSYTGNQPVVVLNRWQKNGDITDIQKFTSDYNEVNDAYGVKGDRAYGNASYIRLKNIYLSYSLPELFTKRLKIENFKLFIQAQNLLTITNFIGDPETQSSEVPPPLKIVSIGLQLTL